MAEKISIEQVDELQALLLRSDVSVDAKVQHVTSAKSSIKQHNVPDVAVVPLFEALRTASASQHVALVNAGYTGLGHLITRLSRQDPRMLGKEAARTLPMIVDKLGDQKEKFRLLSQQALTTFYAVAPMDVERSLRNTAMVGKNPRAKEASMQWLLQMHADHGLPFRAYVPALMELLEDADGMVRDAAKATVIELFRTAPNGAKTDLKKQLKNFKVRPAIEQAIVKELVPTPTTTVSSISAADLEIRPESARSLRPTTASSFSSAPHERPVTPGARPVTPLPETTGRAEPVEPSYVNTQRELEDIFREMQGWFEGKETEQNWLKREESVNKLRRLMAGNAADFHEIFLTSVRAMLDGLIKAMVSLRTSLCKEGCGFIQDLAHVFGPGIDPMVEILLQTLIKLSAGTKKISSQLANASVDAILAEATYNSRMMQHVWFACQDKNVQPRTYATTWVRTILIKEVPHKERFEHTGGLDVLEKCIKKGLLDTNPGVRERMRSTYWAYYGVWPSRAEELMSTLDATAQKLLQKDPNNPNPPKKVETKTPVRPGMGFSKSTMSVPKPSLREAMMAKKKEAMATRNLPSRPGSAMAHFSPVRTTTAPASASTQANSSGRQRTEGGGLSVAPVRATKRRPEMHARPATAGPYSVRTHDHPSVEQSSPSERPRSKTTVVTPKSLAASPKRTGVRSRMGHKASASESSVASPIQATAPQPLPTTEPMPSSPIALRQQRGATPASPRMSPPQAMPAERPGTSMSYRSSPRAEFSPQRRVVEATAAAEAVAAAAAVTAAAAAAMAAVAATEATEAPAAMQLHDQNVAFDQDLMEGEMSPPPLKVYEDPLPEDQAVAKPAAALFTTTALEDRPINEDVVVAASAAAVPAEQAVAGADAESMPLSMSVSPEKMRQNARLLDSGIARVKARSLDVHGFRKLQGIIRDAGSIGGGALESKATLLTDERFDALLLGLFAYLQAGAEKSQDVKAQILATIKLMLKKGRESFQPHVSRGLEALLAARATYDARTHIVAGLELLADELVTLGDASEIVQVVGGSLSGRASGNGNGNGNGPAPAPEPGHTLSMGLHVLKVLVDARPTFQPTDTELGLLLTGLAQQCLESSESGVRMDAVQLCVAVHERVGDVRFWAALPGVKDDPRSLITYYIVKRQREGR